jgi:hypothetical protein
MFPPPVFDSTCDRCGVLSTAPESDLRSIFWWSDRPWSDHSYRRGSPPSAGDQNGCLTDQPDPPAERLAGGRVMLLQPGHANLKPQYIVVCSLTPTRYWGHYSTVTTGPSRIGSANSCTSEALPEKIFLSPRSTVPPLRKQFLPRTVSEASRGEIGFERALKLISTLDLPLAIGPEESPSRPRRRYRNRPRSPAPGGSLLTRSLGERTVDRGQHGGHGGG